MHMNTTSTILICISILISSHSLLAQSLVGNGNIVEVERDVEPFTSVSTSHGWDIILSQGNTHEMTIEADENLIQDLQTEVVRGHLKIYFEKGIRVRQAKRKKIYLTFVNLEGINASGGSDVIAESHLQADEIDLNLSGGSDLDFESIAVGNFRSNLSGGSDARVTFKESKEIYVNASGGSDINFKNIDADHCELTLSGGSDATLNGHTKSSSISSSGGSDIKGGSFSSGESHISLSGGSDGTFDDIDQLDITLGGSSDFECSGNPKIKHQNISKSSSLRIR